MQSIQVGLVGAGYWGPNHLRVFHELPDAKLTWVCDRQAEQLAKVNEHYPQVRTTCDFSELLQSDIDAVVIATPIATHAPLALAALRAGKHVLLEKPMATCVHEAEQLVAAGRRVGRVLMVGHTFEYNPAVETLRQIIAGGELGEIYYINSTRVNLGLFQPDVNVIWDLAPHDISILQFILGMTVESVSATGGIYIQQQAGIHDVAYLTLHFPGRILANVHVSWLDPCKIRQVTVVGSKKMLVYDDIAPEHKLTLYDKGVALVAPCEGKQGATLAYRRGEATPYPMRWHEPLKAECQHFLDCIHTGATPRSSGEDGLGVVRVLAAAQRSLCNGGRPEVV